MHRRGGGHHEVAGDMRGKNMAQGKEASEVDHSRDDTE